ncbi:unnamed protein product [Urochloa decumbens]|uniref:Rx N-terminal domain-containing protein n=1 Tax=Urochloa decumbens TaxID=240449 RepID=A0ABC9GGQ6_9POAL
MVSAATGVMNSAVNKLTAFLGEEYRLVTNVKQRIRFMRDELSSMHAVLQRLDEVDDDQIDVQAKDWRSKVRELSYDIEDCVDRFMLLDSSKNARLNFVQSMVCKIKELWEDRKISKAIKELKDRVVEEKKRRDRYDIGQHLTITPPVHLDPRAHILYEEARDLVWHRWGRRLLPWRGTAVRRAEELFDCRGSVSISRTLDIKKLLRDILFQINESEYYRSERWETEQLIRKLRGYLMDKRYLIVIDDIWSISAWEQVKCALPVNNSRSRIIATTRSKEVAESCCTGIDGQRVDLPEQIGKLQHLETLDLKRSGINKLPSSIVQLKKLVRLFIPSGVQLPDGIGNMQALEELSTIELGMSSEKAIQEIGDLTKLRFLIVFFYHTEACDAEGHRKASFSSLSKLLMSLRTLYLAHDSAVATALMASCRSTPPLQRLYLPWPLSAIPSQMRSFVNLVRLRISVQNKVTKEGMEILASLPMLASLTVRLKKYDDDIHHARHTVSKQGFQSLLKFSFGGDQEAALEFEAGAMPKVQSLKVELQARCQFKYGQGGLVLGLHNLAVLKYVTVNINCFKAAEEAVQDLEEDVRGALGTHPNHPILVIKREHTHGYDASDDQLIK